MTVGKHGFFWVCVTWFAQVGCGIGGEAPQPGLGEVEPADAGDGGGDPGPPDLPARELPGGDEPADEPGGEPNAAPEGDTRFVRITTTAGEDVGWREIQVFVRGVNVSGVMGRVLASSAAEGAGANDAVDRDETSAWRPRGAAPAWYVVDLGEEVEVERVVAQVARQRGPGWAEHVVELAGADGSYGPYRRWAGRLGDGRWLEDDLDEAGPADPAGELAEDILAEQREDAFVLGDVAVRGTRFEIAGRTWYPKTDFLTAVAPGDDIEGGNTHTYLGRRPADRDRIRRALVQAGYNSIYVYTLNQGDYGAGGRPDNVVTPYGGGGGAWSFDVDRLDAARLAEWRAALEGLLADGLKPFLWLAADDSRDIARAGLPKWRRYVEHMVGAFDDLPVVWVVGLEVDEYWSAEQVRERREVVQGLSGRPVGVHLTTAETRRNRPDYTAGFDFVMAQLASPQDDEAYRRDVRELASAAVPWVASEFNVRGRDGAPSVTERSKRIGRILAAVGDPPRIAGIGNGIALDAADDPPPDDPQPDDPPPDDLPPDDGVPFDLAAVTWLHSDVSGWPETATLRSVTVNDSHICLDYDRANDWPIYDLGDVEVVGNPWIFIQHDGRWWGATWEWLRPGQTCKNRHAVAGDHIKRDPFWEFTPRSGETYGFMVSGLARHRERNVQERTNVVMFTWP